MMEHRVRGREDGFTIIEVMVAAFVMLVGVLGTLALIDTAMGVGSTSRSREAATNLSREIVEAAREIDYGLLLTSTAESRFQDLSGLADADAGTAGWQIKRRGTTYTVTVESCIYDDPKDGTFSQNTGANYCPGLAAGIPTDPNGDDYRKLTVTAAWDTRQVRLIANVVNPAGGFGPRITNLASAPAIDSDDIIKVNAGSTIDVTVTTTAATSLNWDAGDTKHGGQLPSASGATSWQIQWGLGTPPATYDCTTPGWTPDAPAYEMTFQPFDASGTPGDLRTQIVAIDRRLPYAACEFTGGRNPQHGGVVDLQWRASFEGDVASYSVWRQRQGDESSDRLVCSNLPATTTVCTDQDLPNNADTLNYYVRAKQDNWNFGQQLGDPAYHAIAAVGTPNSPPTAPADVKLVTGATTDITWTGSTDSDGSVIFYRIYRDGQTVARRYARTSNASGTTFTFTDKNTGGTAHTYYVSAVDNEFAESSLVPAS